MASPLHLIFPLISSIFAILTIVQPRVCAHDNFPQWDPINWLVRSTDHVELACYHPDYYPFNDMESILKMQWILPKSTSYLHLSPGTAVEGWIAMDKTSNYTLLIERKKVHVPEAANGMYVCAALAKVFPDQPSNRTHAWFYLRWGVGMYTNVPAMQEGTLGQRYYWCFTYACASSLVGIAIMVLFSLTMHFRYKAGPPLPSADEWDALSESSSMGDYAASTLKMGLPFEGLDGCFTDGT